MLLPFIAIKLMTIYLGKVMAKLPRYVYNKYISRRNKYCIIFMSFIIFIQNSPVLQPDASLPTAQRAPGRQGAPPAVPTPEEKSPGVTKLRHRLICILLNCRLNCESNNVADETKKCLDMIRAANKLRFLLIFVLWQQF